MNNYMPEGFLLTATENSDSMRSLSALQAAYATGRVLEQRAVLFDTDKNLVVNLGPIKGVIPYEECAIGIKDGSTREISVISRVGKPVSFVITGFSQYGGEDVAMLSRRAVQERCMKEYINALVPGDIIQCRVTHLEQFGCFVDVGCGITSLLPIDAISVSRISHPSDRVAVGDILNCVVKSFDDCGRLLLTHKELLGTWEQNAAMFQAGETVSGIVRSIEGYGVFVELTPNLAGLSDPYPNAQVGQRASVYIKSIIPDKMKIKLVIIDAFESADTPQPFRYFIESGHLDRFLYSPPQCEKAIETVF